MVYVFASMHGKCAEKLSVLYITDRALRVRNALHSVVIDSATYVWHVRTYVQINSPVVCVLEIGARSQIAMHVS